ncbi:MAG: c-type cytochrome, partial [Methylocapsa sp.]|nr:c-type cytochrome [Methylocapsa sp.]
PEGAPPLPGERPAPEMVSLGKMLYFDPRLSEKQDMSCNSCHNLAMGGASGHGSLGGRLTPTVFNAVFNTAQFWDGRASNLKEQVVKSVMVNPAALLVTRGGAMTPNTSEMNIAKQRTAERLKSIPGYVPAFKKAFPSEAEPITYDNIGRAIAAFETTLITPDAPFDRWLRGDDAALSEVQKQGLKLFMDKGCSNCHNGTNIGGGRFARFGVAKNPGPDLLPADDVGRFALTRDVNDKYVFKVPGLRNVELIPPYFHSGRIWDLNEAVAVMGETQLGQKLSGEETAKIAAFLKSLTGRQPEITIPALPPSVATTIRP